MKTLRLAICDNDRTYCNRLDDYLRSHLNLSFDIVSFTETKILLDFAREHAIALLMISESLFLSLENKLEKGLFSNILIMDETPQGMIAEPKILSDVHIDHVSKYQAASGLVNGIIDFCAETPEDFESVSSHAKLGKSRIIGLYSPVTKSGQTTLSVEMAKAIAREKNKKVIFFSLRAFLHFLPCLKVTVTKTSLTFFTMRIVKKASSDYISKKLKGIEMVLISLCRPRQQFR